MRTEAPLAARMRPRTLEEFVGQGDILGPGKLLRRAIEADRLFSSIILWGPPGSGKTTLAMVEEYGVSRLLGELADELRAGTWRPLPARRVLIPKPGSTERRPLAIAAVRDRIVQAAVKIVLEPVFEADFLPCSYGFRPKRSAHQALAAVQRCLETGQREVYDADLTGYFDSIPHAELMACVARRVSDKAVLHLLKMWLVAPVEEKDARGRRHRTTRNKDEGRGSPQGGSAPADARGSPSLPAALGSFPNTATVAARGLLWHSIPE